MTSLLYSKQNNDTLLVGDEDRVLFSGRISLQVNAKHASKDTRQWTCCRKTRGNWHFSCLTQSVVHTTFLLWRQASGVMHIFTSLLFWIKNEWRLRSFLMPCFHCDIKICTDNWLTTRELRVFPTWKKCWLHTCMWAKQTVEATLCSTKWQKLISLTGTARFRSEIRKQANFPQR